MAFNFYYIWNLRNNTFGYPSSISGQHVVTSLNISSQLLQLPWTVQITTTVDTQTLPLADLLNPYCIQIFSWNLFTRTWSSWSSPNLKVYRVQTYIHVTKSGTYAVVPRLWADNWPTKWQSYPHTRLRKPKKKDTKAFLLSSQAVIRNLHNLEHR